MATAANDNNRVNRMTFAVGPTKTMVIADRPIPATTVKRFDELREHVDVNNVNVDKSFTQYQVFDNESGV